MKGTPGTMRVCLCSGASSPSWHLLYAPSCAIPPSAAASVTAGPPPEQHAEPWTSTPQVPTHTGRPCPTCQGELAVLAGKNVQVSIFQREKKATDRGMSRRTLIFPLTTASTDEKCLREKQKPSAVTRSHLERQETGKHAPWLGLAASSLFSSSSR